MEKICELSGRKFVVSPFEQELRSRLDVPEASIDPRLRFQELLSFWQHFSLHRRPCDSSGRDIISVYDSNCPYPVWHRDTWIEKASPPAAEFNPDFSFYDQLWNLFQTCPIPHNVGLGNENCEYTDDWWYSKNCYLCHSGIYCEDCHYCYRVLSCKDSQYCVFSFYCTLCRDLVDCVHCYSVLHAIRCQNCNDSAFLFDCRNCSNCFMCWNLRSKSYCIENVQYSREGYEQKLKAIDLSSRQQISKLRQHFEKALRERVYWRASEIEKSERSTGAYLMNTKNCINTYFTSDGEDSVNHLRGGFLKNVLDSIGCFKAERVYLTSCAVDTVYEIRNCFNVARSQFLEHCAFCFNCKNCFACCGLVGKEYHIFNKPYQRDEYERLVAELRREIAEEVTGRFFPARFAANPYDESLAAFYFPMSESEQQRLGYRPATQDGRIRSNELPSSEIPDSVNLASQELVRQTFWDDIAQRPFRISAHDIEFAKKNRYPLPDRHYTRHIKELFSWMFFEGELRTVPCALSGKNVVTHIPTHMDARILCEEEYLKQLH